MDLNSLNQVPNISNIEFIKEDELLENLGSWSFITEMLTELIGQVNEASNILDTSLSKEKYKELYLEAHKVKGALATMRFISLSTITGYIENIGKYLYAIHNPDDKSNTLVISNIDDNITNKLKHNCHQALSMYKEGIQRLVEYLPKCMEKASHESQSESDSDDF